MAWVQTHSPSKEPPPLESDIAFPRVGLLSQSMNTASPSIPIQKVSTVKSDVSPRFGLVSKARLNSYLSSVGQEHRHRKKKAASKIHSGQKWLHGLCFPMVYTFPWHALQHGVRFLMACTIGCYWILTFVLMGGR